MRYKTLGVKFWNSHRWVNQTGLWVLKESTSWKFSHPSIVSFGQEAADDYALMIYAIATTAVRRSRWWQRPLSREGR